MSKNTEEDKLKIDNGDVSVTVQPLQQGEYVKPSIHISEKPKEHEQKANQHHYDRPISKDGGGGFGLSEEQVEEINEHLSWLRSKYYEDLKP